MVRRGNKLYKKSCRPYTFSKHECKIFKITHTCSRARSENQFLYAKVQFILVPPQFRPVPPHFVRSGDGTAPEASGSAGGASSAQRFCKFFRQINLLLGLF